MRAGRDVVIFRLFAEKKVADASADHVGHVSGVVESI
jgi:hypothetical protein